MSGYFHVRLNENEELTTLGFYAEYANHGNDRPIPFKQGLVGQVASNQKITFLDNIDPSFISLKIGSFQISLDSMVLVPIVFNQTLYGVIELVFVEKAPIWMSSLLHKISQSTAATLESLLEKNKTQQMIQQKDQRIQELEKMLAEVSVNA
jgi:hypothetical protein